MQVQVWLCHRYCRWPKASHFTVPRLPCPTGEHSMASQRVLLSLWEEKTEEMQISSCSFWLLHTNIPFFPGVFKTLFYFLLPFLCTGCLCNKSRMSCSRLCLTVLHFPLPQSCSGLDRRELGGSKAQDRSPFWWRLMTNPWPSIWPQIKSHPSL